MQFIHELTLDVFAREHNRQIYAKQGDNISRIVKITMTANRTKLVPPDGATAVFRALKPDGHSVLDEVTIEKSTGIITVPLSAQALACHGETRADVSVMEGDTILSTVTFYIFVEAAPIGNRATSTDEFGLLIDATAKANAAAQGADEAAGRANAAAENADESREAADAAEKLRAEAEKGRVAAEADRVTAETDRAAAEDDRDAAEQARIKAEAARKTEEQTRQDNESDRQTAEAERFGAEEARAANEEDRQQAETERQTAEEGREQSEQERNDYENARRLAEQARVEAEAQRVEEHTQIMEEATEATQDAVEAATHPPIIQDGTWWIWNSATSAYEDTGWTARGNILFAAFFVDLTDGTLYMCTDDEYNGPDFRLTEEGFLEVVLNAGNSKE